MSTIFIKRTVNLNGPIIPDTLAGVLNCGEVGSHEFTISATLDNEPFALSGVVTANFIRSDGVTVPLTGSISDGAAVVVLSNLCYNAPGRFALTVFITSEGVTTAIYGCTGTVRQTDSGSIVDPGEIIPSVSGLITAIENAIAEIPADYSQLLATQAPTFSASTAYAAGAYVWYDGTLYRFTAAHAAGSWTGSDATAVTVVGEVSDLKSAFSTVSGVTQMAFEDGYIDIPAVGSVVTPTRTAYANRKSAIAEVSGGQTVSINVIGVGTTSAGGRAWAFLDENYTVISRAASHLTVRDVITAPVGSAYVVLNTRTDTITDYYGYVGLINQSAVIAEASANAKRALSAKDVIVKAAADATNDIVYLANGTTTTNSSYKTTDFIDCTKYSYIEYSLSGGTVTSQSMALLSFFDSNKVFLTCVPAVANNLRVTSATPVPQNAAFVRALCRQGVSYEISATGVVKNSLNEKIDNVKSDIEYGLDGYDLQPVFDDPICYNSDGTTYSGGTGTPYRRMSRKIVCNQFSRIKYNLNGLSGKLLIAFFDANLNLLENGNVVGSGTNTYTEGVISVPSGAVYVSGSWLSSKTDGIYMIAESGTSVDARLTYTEALTGTVMPAPATEVVTSDMTVAQFISAFNAALSGYATQCLCASASFRTLNGLSDFEGIHERVNQNFRQSIYVPGITHEMFCARVNQAFTETIRRYQDIKLNNTIPCDFSVKFTDRSGEPSLYVSPDGSTLYVYGYTRRFATTDGMTWGTPESIVLSDGRSIGHAGFSVVNDTIFLVARDYTDNSSHDLVLYTSPLSDGLNFTFRGVPLPIGHDFGDGLHIDNWGNSFMIKDNGIYYLFIEGRQNVDGNFWDIYLVTCTDPFVDNGDGTIGNWQNCGVAPVIQARNQFNTSGSIAFGNPDIARGCDNRPIRIDGKWYMYFHSTAGSYSYILRAYSEDLVHWVPEFRLFDNRNRPTSEENQSSNADHSLIEFKGRTYFFYTTDINTTLAPHLAYMIDDRPFREMLRLKP